MSDLRRPPLAAAGGVRVVELGIWVAVPSAAAMLAEWGADVVKVESPSGDPMRGIFGAIGADVTSNPPFEQDNRGKRGVMLDLRTTEGRTDLDRLLAGADVFLTNLREGALRHLGLTPAAVEAAHPHLVSCFVTGYGEGPWGDRPSYDLGAFWAASGLNHQLTPPGAPPVNARGAVGDHVTALAVAAAVLAGVVEQRSTGRGGGVDVSLLRTGMHCLSWDLSIQLDRGRVPGPEPRAITKTPLMSSFRARDGRWFFLMALEADRHLGALRRALGRPELLDDERFATAAAVRRHSVEVVELLDAVFATRPLDDWAERFDHHGVWWAPIRSPAEVVADPVVAASGALVDVDGGAGDPGGSRLVAAPASFRDRVTTPPRRAPRLGEHTAEVVAAPDATAEPAGGAT